MSADWPVEVDSYVAAPRGRVASVRADGMEHLYVRAGMSLRQVAEACGVSRETVRRELGALGVALRPPYAPWNRIEVRHDEEGRVRYTYEVHRALRMPIVMPAPGSEPIRYEEHDHAALGEVLWRMDLFGAPAIRGLLIDLGMFDGQEGTPPISKLETQDGHHITRAECAVALRAMRERGTQGYQLALRVRRLCEDAGWDASDMEVGSRVRLFQDLVVALGVGADGHGLIVT